MSVEYADRRPNDRDMTSMASFFNVYRVWPTAARAAPTTTYVRIRHHSASERYAVFLDNDIPHRWWREPASRRISTIRIEVRTL
jgi:hypothetical protein